VLDLPTSLQNNTAASAQSQSFYTNVVTNFDFNLALYPSNIRPHSLAYILGENGPYRRYRVVSWTTLVTITNDSSYNTDFWFSQGELGTDMDSLAEATKQPNTVHKTVGKAGSDSATLKLALSGNGASMTPDIVDGSYEYGTWNTIPNQRSYLNMYAQQAAVNFRYFIQIKHIYRVEFFDRYMPN